MWNFPKAEEKKNDKFEQHEKQASTLSPKKVFFFIPL